MMCYSGCINEEHCPNSPLAEILRIAPVIVIPNCYYVETGISILLYIGVISPSAQDVGYKPEERKK